MRRQFAAILVLVIAGFGALVATAGATDDGPTDRETDTAAAIEALDLPEVDAAVTLHCGGEVDDRGAGSVGCRWQAREELVVASWQLWNIQLRPELGHRNLVAELHPEQSGYTDREVKVPAAYLYAVFGLDAEGEIVAHSRPNLAVVAACLDHDVLRLDCNVRTIDVATDAVARDVVSDVIAPLRPVVGCEWSSTKARSAVGYLVHRSVDGGERELIARTGLDATSIVDDDVAFGHHYTYVVVAVDADENVVARSGAAWVRIPPYDRPTDRQTDEVRDVRPTDRPTDRQTDEVRDVRPTDRQTDEVRDVRRTDRPTEHDRVTDRATRDH